MRDRNPRAPRARYASRRNTAWSVALVAFVVGGLFCGYLFYASVRDIVAYAELPFLPGPAGSPAHSTEANPAPVVHAELKERVNILFLGIDRRPNDPGPWRTDTMIVFSIDPISKTASMLSIPRDLWVTLPDYNIEERINAAHVYGDQLQYPGGGPELAKKTVQYNLGIPIHYYARIDFPGFVKIIDSIGGIQIDVPRDIVDNEYPTPDNQTTRLYIKAGRQQMDGELALKYARTRHDSSDIDRGRRQQQVIMAVRDKVLSLDFPITRIPEQLRLLGDSLQTDMSLEVLYAIAQAARQVPSENIQSGVIDEGMVISWKTPQGWDVLVPQRDRIRVLVSQLVPSPTPQASLGPLGDAEKLAQETARIEVQNGTETAGLASRLSSELRANGYNVVSYGNADRYDYPETVVICYVEKRYTLASLQDYLDIPDTHIVRQSVASPDVDMRVILGANAVSR
jgi:LCP family protein required for cell wall assembly